MSFPLQIALTHGAIWTPSNTWFLWPTRVQISNSISIGSAVFAQLAAERPYTLQRAALSTFQLKIAPSHGGSGPHLIRNSFGVSESTIQAASRLDQPFSHSSAQSVAILHNGLLLRPSKLPLTQSRLVNEKETALLQTFQRCCCILYMVQTRAEPATTPAVSLLEERQRSIVRQLDSIHDSTAARIAAAAAATTVHAPPVSTYYHGRPIE